MASQLTRWDPFAELSELRGRLDRLFEGGGNGQHAWAPRIDMIEEEDRILMRADLPGVRPEEVKIEVEDDVLTISGEHREEKEEKEENYVRRERRFGSFSRSMALPKGVSAKDVEATCEDGVLEVAVPLPEKAKSESVRITPRTKSS